MNGLYQDGYNCLECSTESSTKTTDLLVNVVEFLEGEGLMVIHTHEHYSAHTIGRALTQGTQVFV